MARYGSSSHASTDLVTVLYHQIEKVKKPEDLAERQQNLEQLKKEHGIE